jgi:transcriptional regulator with XRE-family HTH domain
METADLSTWNRTTRCEARALRVGRAIKRRRMALGLGQAELAALAGMPRPYYELIETGEWPGHSAEESAADLLAAVVRALDSELTRQVRAAS